MNRSKRECGAVYSPSRRLMARRPETPAERAHAMFTLLGLRHMCVVDENSRVRGIITRRDLDYAAGHGAWRRNKMAPAPDPVSPSGKAAASKRSSKELAQMNVAQWSQDIVLLYLRWVPAC